MFFYARGKGVSGKRVVADMMTIITTILSVFAEEDSFVTAAARLQCQIHIRAMQKLSFSPAQVWIMVMTL